jgi:hypothetical protein
MCIHQHDDLTGSDSTLHDLFAPLLRSYLPLIPTSRLAVSCGLWTCYCSSRHCSPLHETSQDMATEVPALNFEVHVLQFLTAQEAVNPSHGQTALILWNPKPHEPVRRRSRTKRVLNEFQGFRNACSESQTRERQFLTSIHANRIQEVSLSR